jgi:hypothetical protein
MHMIDPSADHCGRTTDFRSLMGKHAEHFLANFIILQVSSAFFRAKNNMQPYSSQRLRHLNAPISIQADNF